MATSSLIDTTEGQVSSGNCDKSPQWQDILLVSQLISLLGGKKYVGGSCVPVLIYQLEDSGLLKKQDNNVQVI